MDFVEKARYIALDNGDKFKIPFAVAYGTDAEPWPDGSWVTVDYP